MKNSIHIAKNEMSFIVQNKYSQEKKSSTEYSIKGKLVGISKPAT